jgi:hypothetical protein
MPLSWVKVVRNDGGGTGDSIFIDANYVDVAGFVGQPLATDSGQHTFETLDAGGKPAWRKVATIDPPPGSGQDDPVLVTLMPVRRRRP